MLRHLALRALTGALLCMLSVTTASAITVPEDFVVENATPGTGFNNPTAVTFMPDGRILVAEKRGVVRVVVNGVKRPLPMWDGQPEVLNGGDRGLLGIAVDPRYTVNHYVYLLYTVDPDSNNVETDDDAFIRLVRYRTGAGDSSVVDPASRTILFGTSWSDGIPSSIAAHGPGALRWGADRSLLVGCGEGAHYNEADAGGMDDPLFDVGRVDEAQDIGAFRAQSLTSLAGKILRLDPDTGHGYPSNPYYDGNVASIRSRIWAYGLRNPYRFSIRPGTGVTDPAAGNPGVIAIGDVGWNAWEEIDIAPYGGMNFGWPCYDGPGPQPAYQDLSGGHMTCDSIGTVNDPVAPTLPAVSMFHGDPNQSVPPGVEGNCIVMGEFYSTGTYPAVYQGRLFIADFGKNWIKLVRLDSQHQPVEIDDFADDADGPVDFAIDPLSGDLFYLSIYSGNLLRIRYTGPNGGNAPPVANALCAPIAGYAPLGVAFTSAGSSDPDGNPLGYSWLFGDGTSSTAPSPTHTYATPGHYSAVLTVTDGRGGLTRDTVHVEVWNQPGFPSTALIDDFERANGPVGANWVGNTSGLQIVNGEVIQTVTSSYAIWDSAILGVDQEAYVTFAATTNGAEHNVLLKVQGRSWQDGHVQVHYQTNVGGVIALTYTRTDGWKRIGGPWAATFGPGDRLGARAYADGRIEAFKNGTRIGTANTGTWPYAANGGRIGMMLVNAASTRIEEFGGGTFVEAVNEPPVALIDVPADPTFFAAGDTVWLAGNGTDREDAPGSLTYRWEVDLMHNNHVHPASVSFDGASGWFVAENHDDGTGVWLRGRFIAADTQGASDTTVVHLYPEIDLAPSAVWTTPSQVGTAAPATFKFILANAGRMPSPVMHWRLMAGATMLAEGDTLLPGKSHVDIERVIPPLLAPGIYDLRVVVDTLGAVLETDESNNAHTRELVVQPGEGVLDVTEVPAEISLSPAFPNPASSAIGFALALPRAAAVELSVFDLQGRRVWAAAPRTYAAGRWTLRWSGHLRGGRRARPGVYTARVRIGDETLSRPVVVIE